MREEDEMVFYCFLRNIFQITFKYLQNTIIFCFQFVKFPWEKYNMLRPDINGKCSFFVTNCCYAFSNANGIEKADSFLIKISNFVQFNDKNHCCNVRLDIMMKHWKDRMINISNCCEIFYKFGSSGINWEAFNFREYW